MSQKNRQTQQVQIQTQNVQYTIKIYDGIYVGNQDSAQDLDMLLLNHVTRIIILDPSKISPNYLRMGVKYLQIEGWSQIPQKQIDQDSREEQYIPSLDISSVMQFMLQAQQLGQCTLICSIESYSRPFCLLALYLMHRYKWSLFKAFQLLNFRIPNIHLRQSYFEYLKQEERDLLFQNKITSYNWEAVNQLSIQQLVIRNTYVNAKMQKIKRNAFVQADEQRLKRKQQGRFFKSKHKKVQWLDFLHKQNVSLSQEKTRRRIPPTPPIRNITKKDPKSKVSISALKIDSQRNSQNMCSETQFSQNSSKRKCQSERSQNQIKKTSQIIVNVKDVINSSLRNNSNKALKKGIIQTTNRINLGSLKNLTHLKSEKDISAACGQQLDLQRIKKLLNKKRQTMPFKRDDSYKGVVSYQNSITQEYSRQKQQDRKYVSTQIFRQKKQNSQGRAIQKQIDQIQEEEQPESSRAKQFIKHRVQDSKHIRKQASIQNQCNSGNNDRIFTQVFLQNEGNKCIKLEGGNSQCLYKSSKDNGETMETMSTQNFKQSASLKADTARRVVEKLLNTSLMKRTRYQKNNSSRYIEKENRFFLRKKQQSQSKSKKDSSEKSLQKLMSQSHALISSKQKWR